MNARNIVTAAIPWALATNQSGTTISVTRPTARTARCTHTATSPRGLRSRSVLVRRYIHHDAARATTNATTRAHTLPITASSVTAPTSMPDSLHRSTGREVGTNATTNATVPARLSRTSSVSLLPL